MKFLNFIFCFLIFFSCQNDNSLKKENPFIFTIEEFDLEKDYTLTVNNVKKVLYGTFEEHMKWWKARSEQIISEVENKDQFMKPKAL